MEIATPGGVEGTVVDMINEHLRADQGITDSSVKVFTPTLLVTVLWYNVQAAMDSELLSPVSCLLLFFLCV